jgi:2-polyprenyl-6-methoxyphenol hydroxylase-like FAD-dependent oxidoreductase
MANIVVLGAGMVGLSTAMLLARDGHRVTVLERDPAEPPDAASAAWTDWERTGVNQFRHMHIMLPRWYADVRREMPEVIDELVNAGAGQLNLVAMLPPTWTGGGRRADDRFDTVAVRRPVLEAALAAVAARTPGVQIVRGMPVTGLIAEPGITGVPDVVGVLAPGLAVRTDLVVDATGRRSAVPTFLEAIGARRPAEQRADAGFVYYARHYRADPDGSGVPELTATMLSHFNSVSLLTLPADNGTWGVGFIASTRDKQCRQLRDEQTWERVLAMYPDQAQWTAGRPITGIQSFAGIEDRSRNYLVEGAPVVTGLVPVGDAWACTNPSLGRGASLGLLHALTLRDAVREAGVTTDLPAIFAEATRLHVQPLFDATVAVTNHRIAEIDADIAGQPYLTPDPGWAMSSALYTAAHLDQEALRGYLSIAGLLSEPAEVFAAPGFVGRVLQASAGAPRYCRPGPGRAELIDAIGSPAPVMARR